MEEDDERWKKEKLPSHAQGREVSAIKLLPCCQPGSSGELPRGGMCIISYSLSQGGCDAGMRRSDKVLENPEREAWEEAGLRREERTCSWSCRTSPGGPASLGRGGPTSADWFLSFRTQLGWAEAGFSERAGRAPSWSLAKVLPGEGQDVLRVLPQVT